MEEKDYKISTPYRSGEDVFTEYKVITNGFQGGDAGHGGRTNIKLVLNKVSDLAIAVKVNDKFIDNVTELELFGAGDWELSALLEAFKGVTESLESILKNNKE